MFGYADGVNGLPPKKIVESKGVEAMIESFFINRK
jgi:hypothetical protein